MAAITGVSFCRHLRSDPNSHVIHFRSGRAVRSGRGLAFWFVPLSASIAEIPCDDRDQHFLFHGRSRDFQDVAVQGTVTFRIADPEKMAPRIDFTIDARTGRYAKTPLEQLSELLTQLAQQLAWDYMASTPLRAQLADGVDEVRRRIREGLTTDPSLQGMGLEIVSVRVAALSPKSELEKALQAPTREAIQQAADEAVFQRRAMAVDKERAIAENELQNRIELARREQELISQQGANRRRKATEAAEAGRIRSRGGGGRRPTPSGWPCTAICPATCCSGWRRGKPPATCRRSTTCTWEPTSGCRCWGTWCRRGSRGWKTTPQPWRPPPPFRR